MIYFYYKIRNKEFRLNEVQHKFISSEVAKGKTMIILDAGRTMLNMNHCAYWEIDGESVIKDQKEKQAKENMRLPKLPPASQEAQEKKYKEGREKMAKIRTKLFIKEILKPKRV